MTLPEVAGKMPVMTLNSVVLPAPFGPMMALRSPGKICRSMFRNARTPPKLLHSPSSARTGPPQFMWISTPTMRIRCLVGSPPHRPYVRESPLLSLFHDAPTSSHRLKRAIGRSVEPLHSSVRHSQNLHAGKSRL